LKLLCSRRRQPQRLALELAGDVVDRTRDRGAELVELLDDGDRRDRDQSAHHREAREQGERGGRPLEVATAAEPRRDRR
jgi:hypothetical protein